MAKATKKELEEHREFRAKFDEATAAEKARIEELHSERDGERKERCGEAHESSRRMHAELHVKQEAYSRAAGLLATTIEIENEAALLGDVAESRQGPVFEDDDEEEHFETVTTKRSRTEYSTGPIVSFQMGDVVNVHPRTGYGMNRRGGWARVVNVHNVDGTKTYDVAYIIGRERERNLSAEIMVRVSDIDNALQTQDHPISRGAPPVSASRGAPPVNADQRPPVSSATLTRAIVIDSPGSNEIDSTTAAVDDERNTESAAQDASSAGDSSATSAPNYNTGAWQPDEEDRLDSRKGADLLATPQEFENAQDAGSKDGHGVEFSNVATKDKSATASESGNEEDSMETSYRAGADLLATTIENEAGPSPTPQSPEQMPTMPLFSRKKRLGHVLFDDDDEEEDVETATASRGEPPVNADEQASVLPATLTRAIIIDSPATGTRESRGTMVVDAPETGQSQATAVTQYKTGKWLDDEVARLRQALVTVGPPTDGEARQYERWWKISAIVKTRSNVQCQNKFYSLRQSKKTLESVPTAATVVPTAASTSTVVPTVAAIFTAPSVASIGPSMPPAGSTLAVLQTAPNGPIVASTSSTIPDLPMPNSPGYYQHTKRTGPFTDGENGRTTAALTIYNPSDLKSITEYVRTRTRMQMGGKLSMKRKKGTAPKGDNGKLPWTEEEDAILRMGVPDLNNPPHGYLNDLVSMLEGRTKNAVQNRVRKLAERVGKGSGRWTEDEVTRFNEALCANPVDSADLATRVSRIQKRVKTRTKDQIRKRLGNIAETENNANAEHTWRVPLSRENIRLGPLDDDERQRWNEALELYDRGNTNRRSNIVNYMGTRTPGQVGYMLDSHRRLFKRRRNRRLNGLKAGEWHRGNSSTQGQTRCGVPFWERMLVDRFNRRYGTNYANLDELFANEPDVELDEQVPCHWIREEFGLGWFLWHWWNSQFSLRRENGPSGKWYYTSLDAVRSVAEKVMELIVSGYPTETAEDYDRIAHLLPYEEFEKYNDIENLDKDLTREQVDAVLEGINAPRAQPFDMTGLDGDNGEDGEDGEDKITPELLQLISEHSVRESTRIEECLRARQDNLSRQK